MTRLLLFVGLAAGALSTPPPTTAADPPATVRLPALPTPPAQPLPAAGDATPLLVDELYVVDSDVELFVRAYPAGLLSVNKDSGPLRVRGKFVGGNGRTETKTFKGPHLYLVESAHKGTADLVLVPKGLAAEDQILTRRIESLAGPRPPPDPIDPIKPPVDPTAVTNPFGDLPGLRVLIVYETNAPLPIGQGPVLNGVTTRTYLDSHCAVGLDGKTREYRIWDKDVTGTELESLHWGKTFGKLRPGVPYVYIGNGKAGEEGPLPKTVDEAMMLFRKYGGN